MGECGIGNAGIYIKFCSKLTGASNISFELLKSGLGKLEYIPEFANIPQTVKVYMSKITNFKTELKTYLPPQFLH